MKIEKIENLSEMPLLAAKLQNAIDEANEDMTIVNFERCNSITTVGVYTSDSDEVEQMIVFFDEKSETFHSK